MMQIPARRPTMESPASETPEKRAPRPLSIATPTDDPEFRVVGEIGTAPPGFVGSLPGRLWNSGWTLLVLGNVFWASNIIVGRAILGDVPAIALSFWRWTGAFAVAIWFAWPHLKKDWPLLLADWKIMLALGA